MSYKAPVNEMQRLLRVRDRINTGVKTVNNTIKQFKKDVDRCKEKIDRTSPGPAQEALKVRKKTFIMEKKWYEGQRDMLQNQALKLDRVIFALEGIKDAQQIVSDLKELTGVMNNLQDDMKGLIDGSNEIMKTLGASHNVHVNSTKVDEFVADEVVFQPKTEPGLKESRGADSATRVAFQRRTYFDVSRPTRSPSPKSPSPT